MLLCIRGGGGAATSDGDAPSGAESLNHLMFAAGLASARHLRLKKLAASSGAVVSGCGFVSSRTSGVSGKSSISHVNAGVLLIRLETSLCPRPNFERCDGGM